jgi:purine-binding chemotaxis protein CheW
MNTKTPIPTGLGEKYLTFRLGDESYGLNVLKVREIIRHTAITGIPQLPGDFIGVINLRGKIIPVLDLRKRFGLPVGQLGNTCIIVVQVARLDGNPALTGLVVDAVEEVTNIGAAEIEKSPDFGGVVADYLLGMAKIKGAVKALLDIDRIVGRETIHSVCAAIT